MIGDTAGLRRSDGIVWGIVLAVAAGMLAFAAMRGFTIGWTSFAAPAGAAVALSGAAWFYRACRRDARAAAALDGTAQVVAFTMVAAPLSYAAASLSLPLQDAAFQRIDEALGFDWSAVLAMLDARPAAFAALRIAYLSLTVQLTATVLLLAFTGRLRWLRVYTLAFVLAALVTIAVSALVPAEGAWLHYGIAKAGHAATPVSQTSWQVFHALRDGSYRTLVSLGAEGIITFPSLHAALAVILTVSLWPLRWVRWVSAMVNAMMLAATPVDGSHYLVDVLAGVGVAILCVSVARAVVTRLDAPRPAMRRMAAPMGDTAAA